GFASRPRRLATSRVSPSSTPGGNRARGAAWTYPAGGKPAWPRRKARRMNHQETYRHNEAYAEFLASWDAAFYAKYADTLKPSNPGARVLDVGCGVGQVVA